MNRTRQSLQSCIIASCCALVVFFSSATAWCEQDRLRNEVRQFHIFLHSRPKVANELRSNSTLVNSKRYLDSHDDLAKFLKRYPRVKLEIVNHPSRVFGSYYR
jgi:hypothetical protein